MAEAKKTQQQQPQQQQQQQQETSGEDAYSVEATFERIKNQNGVEGLIVVSYDEVIMRSTMNPSDTQKYARLVLQLTQKTINTIRDLDTTVSIHTEPSQIFENEKQEARNYGGS